MNFNITYDGYNFTISFENGTTVGYTFDKSEPISNFTSFLDGLILAGKVYDLDPNSTKEPENCKCKLQNPKEADVNIIELFNKYFGN